MVNYSLGWIDLSALYHFLQIAVVSVVISLKRLFPALHYAINAKCVCVRVTNSCAYMCWYY